MSNENLTRVRGMLGFAMRAGKIILGTEQVLTALSKKGRVRLVVIAQGISDSTKKKITVKCEFYGVRTIEPKIDADELGTLLGKTYAPACAAVTDEGFARELVLACADNN